PRLRRRHDLARRPAEERGHRPQCLLPPRGGYEGNLLPVGRPRGARNRSGRDDELAWLRSVEIPEPDAAMPASVRDEGNPLTVGRNPAARLETRPRDERRHRARSPHGTIEQGATLPHDHA